MKKNGKNLTIITKGWQNLKYFFLNVTKNRFFQIEIKRIDMLKVFYV